MIYGYVRVSTERQITDRQDEALKEYANKNSLNFTEIFKDKVSGKNFERPNYERMKTILQNGDTLIIKEIDRLGRDWDMTAAEWKYYLDNGIKIIVIDTPLLNTNSEEMTLETRLVKEQVFTLMLYLAQKEREKISQRTKEALKIKKLQGVVLGRPEKNLPTDEILLHYNRGKSYDEICNSFDVSKGTVAKIVKNGIKQGLCEARRHSWAGV